MADDLCLSSTCKSNNSFIPSVFFYDLTFICSFIVSHPLYLSYFIFFSPYLFKFIFFITPLFFTTSLLLILSVIATTFPHSKLGLDKLRSKVNGVDEDDDEFLHFEDFDIYKIVFHDPPPLGTVGEGDDEKQASMVNTVSVAVVTKSEEERNLERLFEELDRFEDRKNDENSFCLKGNPWRLDASRSLKSCESIGDATTTNDNETRPCTEEVVGELLKFAPVKVSSLVDDQKSVTNSKSTASFETKEKEKRSYSSEEKKTVQNSFSVKSNPTAVIETKDNETRSHVREIVQKLEPATCEDQESVQHSWRMDSSSSFGSYGSMRKEKEWKRTLACKLFEERNNSSGGEEGMDSLWEAYEEDNSSRKSKNRIEAVGSQKKSMVKNKKKSEFKYFDDGEEEDDEEFMSNGQLCCLKALKLSTGKMNLGMGKPNLVKISKALKGFGWLHHVGSKHGKRN